MTYQVEVKAITGEYVPKDGIYQEHSLLSAAIETFAARLQGEKSRITKGWDTIVEIPARAAYVSPVQFYRLVPAIKTSLRSLYA